MKKKSETELTSGVQVSLAHIRLEAFNWHHLSDFPPPPFVFRIYIVFGFEEEDSLENSSIWSCFLIKKRSV